MNAAAKCQSAHSSTVITTQQNTPNSDILEILHFQLGAVKASPPHPPFVVMCVCMGITVQSSTITYFIIINYYIKYSPSSHVHTNMLCIYALELKFRVRVDKEGQGSIAMKKNNFYLHLSGNKLGFKPIYLMHIITVHRNTCT